MNHKQGCPMISTGWSATMPPYCTCNDNQDKKCCVKCQDNSQIIVPNDSIRYRCMCKCHQAPIPDVQISGDGKYARIGDSIYKDGELLTSPQEEKEGCECRCMPCEDAKFGVEGVSHCFNGKCGKKGKDEEKTTTEGLREEIAKEIDFMCDHWVEHDNKAPYSFGGWREEIIDKLYSLLSSERQRMVEKVGEELKHHKHCRPQGIGMQDDGVRTAEIIGFHRGLHWVKALLTDKEE